MSDVKVLQAPMKLPLAPERYDKRDQDHTRRLIETALAASGLSIAALGNIPVPSFAGRQYIPQSPLHGTANITGSATGLPVVQLLNPAGSGKNLVVYEYSLVDDSVNVRARTRATDTPLVLTGATTFPSFRRDENDATAGVAVLQGGTVTSTQVWAEPQSVIMEFANTFTNMTGDGRRNVIEADGFPIIVPPGHAIEAVYNQSSTFQLSGYFTWDELAAPVFVVDDTTTRPHSLIAGASQGTSAGGQQPMVQLKNPGGSQTWLRVLGVFIGSNAGPTLQRIMMKRVTIPRYFFIGSATNTVLGVPVRLDGTSEKTGIVGQITGAGQIGNAESMPFTEAFCNWSNVVSNCNWTPVIDPRGSFPIWIAPGSALEIGNNAGTNQITVVFLWDEVPFGASVGGRIG